MLTIWKFGLPMQDSFEIEMPEIAHILTVQTQGADAFLWAEVDPTAVLVKREFKWRGTGHKLDFNLVRFKYQGTIQLKGGAIIFHLYG